MRRFAWLGIVIAVSTSGCGLLIDTSPPDVLVADAASSDGAVAIDASDPLDTGPDDGGVVSTDGDVSDANVTLDAGPPDLGPPDLGPDMYVCLDADGDGVTDCAGDCDDADSLSAPGLPELCGDGADNDCNGVIDDLCTGGIGTFVSATNGDDASPGTRADPVRTIAQGMINARTLGGPQTVIVAEGMYGEKVTLAHGIDLRGGYQCASDPCSWVRGPRAYPSIIANTDFEGVLAPAGVTRSTLFEGFRVLGRSGTATAPGSAGITLLGGSPTLRGNEIIGGNVSGGGFTADRSIGVHLRTTTDAAGALLEGNDIRGGMSSNVSVAVMFDSYPLTTTSLATVEGNVLRGGTAVRSVGLIAFSAVAGTLVQHNDIFAGNSVGGVSLGIEVGRNLTINANRINAGPMATGLCTTPANWCAGITSESSTSIITNNVIFGALGPRSAGVFLGEFEVAAGTVVLNGNLLDGGGGGGTASGASTRSAALVVSIGACTTCGFRGAVGRVRNNILRGGLNTNRFGVLEDPSVGRTMRPEVLENNLFTFAPLATRTDVLYRQVSPTAALTDHVDVSTINVLLAPPASANLMGDPLVDPATWHTLPGSPVIDSGTGVEAPPADFEGDARPRGAGVDIGPDET